jgi:hypothetical protein
LEPQCDAVQQQCGGILVTAPQACLLCLAQLP